MQNYSLITSLVTGFGLALPFGYLAERFLRSPALVGYILAGVAVGIIPGLPPVNEAMIEQLAEIGVMLLMFGVGLHFSVRDLLNVRTAVVPWAAVQMMVTAILGACVAMGFWHWSFGAAVLFGLTISCASTVVVTKALELRRMTNEINGQVAIGWLVMEDLMSVVLLVCLPPFAQAVQGADVSLSAVAWKVATTLIWAAVFVVLMLVQGDASPFAGSGADGVQRTLHTVGAGVRHRHCIRRRGHFQCEFRSGGVLCRHGDAGKPLCTSGSNGFSAAAGRLFRPLFRVRWDDAGLARVPAASD